MKFQQILLDLALTGDILAAELTETWNKLPESSRKKIRDDYDGIRTRPQVVRGMLFAAQLTATNLAYQMKEDHSMTIASVSKKDEKENKSITGETINVSTSKPAKKYVEFSNGDGDTIITAMDRPEELATELRYLFENECEDIDVGSEITLKVVSFTDLELELMPERDY